jgi:hypothetical protein
MKDFLAFVPRVAASLALAAFVVQRLDVRRTCLRLSPTLEQPSADVLLAHTGIDNVVVGGNSCRRCSR